MTIVAIACAATAAGRGVPRLYRMDLEGYLGPPATSRKEEADLVLGCNRKTLRFQVTNGRLLGGSALMADVYERVAPYKPNFLLRGPKDLLSRCEGFKDGDRIRLLGAWRAGSRDLLLSDLEREPPQ